MPIIPTSADELAQAVVAAGFTADERKYASAEACGTFALALFDLLEERGELPQIVAFGWDSAWEDSKTLGYKLPGLIRRGHLNHVTVLHQGRYFDIAGEHEPGALAAAYEANGMVALQRAVLRRKTGPDDRQPLYFDGDFYLETKRRLAAALEALQVGC